jgi:transposase
MHQQTTPADYSGQQLFVGLDVHKASWRVSIYTSAMEHKTFTQPPHPEALLTYLHRNFPGATVQCAYEAGFSGFSTAHALRAAGIDCLVVHPPDIPTTEYDRRHKNDRNDARRLARELRSGSMHSVYIPTEEELEARSLVRMRGAFIKKQTRCKTQIRMALMFWGVRIPSTVKDRYWSRSFIAWLENRTLTTSHGTAALGALLDELRFLREKVLDLTRQIRAMAQSPTYQPTVRILTTVPGIGVLTAMTLITELMTMERFRDSNALASYVGLIPGEMSSGDKIKTTGVTSRRNAVLRHLLIECTWIAIHNDPALLQVFEKACNRMIKTKAIVMVARRLLNRIRTIWLTGVDYQIGIAAGTPSPESNSAVAR